MEGDLHGARIAEGRAALDGLPGGQLSASGLIDRRGIGEPDPAHRRVEGASPQLTLAIHIDAPEAEYTGGDRVQSMSIRAPEWDAISSSAGVMVQLPLR